MKKTDNYGAVMAEIQRLQQRAQELRKSELPGVVKRIREAIEAYSLTAADLGFGAAAASPGSAGPKRARKPGATTKATIQTGVARYRDPKSGKTWTGRGKPPLWIVGAKDRTPFLIDGGAAASDDTGATAAKPARQARKAVAKPTRRGAGVGRKRGRTAAPGTGDNPADGAGNGAS